ncbi:MAG: response regulator, partial [Clostridiales Family XIII bacterium]|nr:response regulator [Clostridiales Family XIII bacterium]
TAIFSNAGAVAAHPNGAYLAKDLTEVFAYEMLISDAVKARAAADAAIAAQTSADAEARAAYDGAREFVRNLQASLGRAIVSDLDPTLMTPEMAALMLRAADADRLRQATEIAEAIASGEMYISNDEDSYTVYMPIRFSEVTNPWSVAVSIPMTKILDNANDIRNYVLLVSAIAICLIALLLYLIARNITKPLLVLSESAKLLGEGRFDADIPVTESNDEIGALSKAFKFMAEKINNLIKEMQKYAKTLEEKNVYLNRLNELKDEFLANTSHELRTPINGIIGIVESMIDGATGPLSKEQKYNLAIVSNSGKRLSNMINDILDFTKLKNREIILQIRPVDLKTIVDTVLILSKPLIKGKDLSMVNEIDDALPAVGADENRIQQILYNLIGNAIKFTEKGRIVVSASVTPDGDMVAVSVADTGIGISEDKFDQIFESFEQADGSTAREYGGTGLGLSISKKIIELHGGTISVASKPGEGAVFTFTMPLSDAKREETALREAPRVIDIETFAADAETTERAPAAANAAGFRILAVDDEPVNIQVLNNLLTIRDYSVTAAYNGMEALDLFERGENFDLVLLDVMMPKMSGYEVCRRLRERYSLFELPIIMLTAKNRIQDVVLGFQSGANDYIQKPFDKEELLARARTLLELKGAMSAAMAANRAKSLFLANMSHEIRTPLSAVIGLADLLLKTPMDEKQRDYTEKMRRASSSLLGIINDILDFSEADTGNMRLECVSFNLRQLFDDLAIFFRGRDADSGVELRFELDSALPEELTGDPRRLLQIFINLLDNAYKFTEAGTVTVRAAVSARDAETVTLDFAVTDTGIGMKQEQMDEIFSAFNQADNSSTRKYGGAGIGLTVTRQMVELMGGRITVSGEEGKGTTFAFSCTFPSEGDSAAQGSPAQSGAADTRAERRNAALQNKRILLVEDNEINTLIAAELLTAVGIEVVTAQNGEEALARLADSNRGDCPPFDLVLMDLQMPVMDGYEATETIRSMPEYRELPIYALTAHAFPEDRERCLSLGMNGHLTKPIDAESFYDALRTAVAPETD